MSKACLSLALAPGAKNGSSRLFFLSGHWVLLISGLAYLSSWRFSPLATLCSCILPVTVTYGNSAYWVDSIQSQLTHTVPQRDLSEMLFTGPRAFRDPFYVLASGQCLETLGAVGVSSWTNSGEKGQFRVDEIMMMITVIWNLSMAFNNEYHTGYQTLGAVFEIIEDS